MPQGLKNLCIFVDVSRITSQGDEIAKSQVRAQNFKSSCDLARLA